jgi:hypothetical protein
MRKWRWRFTGPLLCLLGVALVVALEVKLAHPTITPAITPQNFAFLHKGMTREEVESILGPATKVDQFNLPSWYSLVWQDDEYKDGLEHQSIQGGCWIGITFWGNNTSRNPQDQPVVSRSGSLRVFSHSKAIKDLPLAEQPDPFLARWGVLPTAPTLYVPPPSTFPSPR